MYGVLMVGGKSCSSVSGALDRSELEDRQSKNPKTWVVTNDDCGELCP